MSDAQYRSRTHKPVHHPPKYGHRSSTGDRPRDSDPVQSHAAASLQEAATSDVIPLALPVGTNRPRWISRLVLMTVVVALCGVALAVSTILIRRGAEPEFWKVIGLAATVIMVGTILRWAAIEIIHARWRTHFRAEQRQWVTPTDQLISRPVPPLPSRRTMALRLVRQVFGLS